MSMQEATTQAEDTLKQAHKPASKVKAKPPAKPAAKNAAPKAPLKAAKAKPKSKAAGRAPAAADDAKIVWLGKPIPWREGSGAHQRSELVRSHSGKSVGTFLQAKGARRASIATLLRMGLLKLESK